jgi:hypothetical protein
MLVLILTDCMGDAAYLFVRAATTRTLRPEFAVISSAEAFWAG